MYSWLKTALNKVALRKNMLRSDMHIAFPSKNELFDKYQIENLVHSFLEASTARGLDIIGIVSDWLYPGEVAKKIVKQKNIDIFVLSGQEVVTKEGLRLLVFNLKKEIPQRLEWTDCLKTIHNNNGLVIVIKPSRRWVQRLNKIVNSEWAPEGIEVYNPNFSEYIDIDADVKYEFFMTSCAKKPNDLLQTNINTKNKREWWVKHGIFDKDFGKEYIPDYLKSPYYEPGQFMLN
jgi:hypothetical protein